MQPKSDFHASYEALWSVAQGTVGSQVVVTPSLFQSTQKQFPISNPEACHQLDDKRTEPDNPSRPDPGRSSFLAVGPREWTTAHWTGKRWDFSTITTSDHNYDMGSLYVRGASGRGVWQGVGPLHVSDRPNLLPC